MNNYTFLLIICLFCFQITWSQTIEIHGEIVSEVLDLENINIYNSTSKNGTITNKEGAFVISAKLNDVIKISSLSFKKVTVIINEKIIKSKAFTVLVNEEVNTLDEVVILTHNLTGELLVDVEKAEYFEPIPIDFGTINNLDFEDIRMDKIDNVSMKKGQLYNGFNPIEVLKLFGVKFKKKKTQKKLDTEKSHNLSDRYSSEFFHKNFKIPLNKIASFHAFVEENPLTHILLKKANEIELLEFLLRESKLFLKSIDEQN